MKASAPPLSSRQPLTARTKRSKVNYPPPPPRRPRPPSHEGGRRGEGGDEERGRRGEGEDEERGRRGEGGDEERGRRGEGEDEERGKTRLSVEKPSYRVGEKSSCHRFDCFHREVAEGNSEKAFIVKARRVILTLNSMNTRNVANLSHSAFLILK